MKKLEVLKQELMEDKLNQFYVFYGEDYGIRKHYINKIRSYFKSKTLYRDTFTNIDFTARFNSLFGSEKQLVIFYEDAEFLNLKESEVQDFIDNLNDYTVIFVYEILPEKSVLYTKFDNYVTYFPCVQDNIAEMFVANELNIFSADARFIAKNCNNNYNAILLETEKIREYSEAKNMSNQNAYETLRNQYQLNVITDKFNVNDFMNDVLNGDLSSLSYWETVVNSDENCLFKSLVYIFNDYLIAGIIKQFGKYDGSREAYKRCKLPWGRVKIIREFNLYEKYEIYFDKAFKVANIDALVKLGKLQRDDVFDYFITEIL